MADRMAAEIWIGGKLPRGLLEEFPISDLCVDWENTRLASPAEADILAARDTDGLLHFAEVEAAWGEFQTLEEWLREHNIPFRRRSEGTYDYSPCIVEFRPELKGKRNHNVYAITSPEGASLVLVSKVEAITTRMAKLAGDRKRSATQRLQAWEKLLRSLTLVLPPQLPSLLPFEIGED